MHIVLNINVFFFTSFHFFVTFGADPLVEQRGSRPYCAAAGGSSAVPGQSPALLRSCLCFCCL